MPSVEDFGTFKVHMYFGDHNPPHVHVIGPDFEAQMRIADQTLMAGTLSGQVERQAAAFIKANQKDLMKRWNDYRT